jgi:hypothetical protein
MTARGGFGEWRCPSLFAVEKRTPSPSGSCGLLGGMGRTGSGNGPCVGVGASPGMTVCGSFEARNVCWVEASVWSVVQVACCVGSEVRAACWAVRGSSRSPRVMTVMAMSGAFDAVPAVLVGVEAGRAGHAAGLRIATSTGRPSSRQCHDRRESSSPRRCASHTAVDAIAFVSRIRASPVSKASR